MRFHHLFCGILLFLPFSNLTDTAIAQPERIVEGELVQRWWEGPKTVPIQKWQDTLYVMLTDDEATRIYWKNVRENWWQDDNSLGLDRDDLEFFVGPSSTKYAHGYWDGILWYINDNEVIWREVSCPGRPVIDRENNLHLIWEAGEDTLYYGFSRDTLNTFEVIDTLVAFPSFVYLVSSPDRAIIGAVFYNPEADSLYKFIAIEGNPIDFSSPSSWFCEFSPIYAYDLMLDPQGRLIFVQNGAGCPWNWGAHNVWTEQYGRRFLECADDEAMQPVCFEIAFGPEDGEILLIGSTYFIYDIRWTWFLASLNGGDTWYRSALTLDAKYGSSLRSYGDSLDLVYDGEEDVYYYAVPRDLIFDDLTGIADRQQEMPRGISLSNYPNPFNSSTTISFTVPEPSRVDLSIYDIRGRLVNILLRSGVEAGYHSLVWDGTDRFGNSVSSGVYIYKIKVDDHVESRRMLLLK